MQTHPRGSNYVCYCHLVVRWFSCSVLKSCKPPTPRLPGPQLPSVHRAVSQELCWDQNEVCRVRSITKESVYFSKSISWLPNASLYSIDSTDKPDNIPSTTCVLNDCCVPGSDIAFRSPDPVAETQTNPFHV
jgi:hypothetical protein